MDIEVGHWDQVHRRGIRSAWTENPVVAQRVMLRMTGVSKFWLNWAFEDYLKKTVRNLLSVGCGDGTHELIIARNGYAERIDAFDASSVGIARARAAAQKEGLRNVNFYVDTFENFCSRSFDNEYDVIMVVGSLHHARDLEAVLEKIRSLLSDEGRLIFNEYVGACYNIYPSKQVSVINRLLGALHPIFKASPDAQLKNPTIEMVLAHDPSESVRSALILQFLQFYFEIEHLAFFGGTVLHPIFDQLNGRKLSDGSPESESIVRLLIEIEELLLENNVLLHDFCFGFCRRESGTRIKA